MKSSYLPLDAAALPLDSLHLVNAALSQHGDQRNLFHISHRYDYAMGLPDRSTDGGPRVEEIATEKVHLAVADGSAMDAFVARPTRPGKCPGIVVFQEAFGVDAHIRDVTERFAKIGLVAIAPELFHRIAAGVEIKYEDLPTAIQYARASTTDQMILDIKSAYEWLANDAGVHTDRIASVGFCMGGRASFLACAKVPLQAAISFYGGGIAPSLLPHVAELHAPILFFWGGLDKHIGQDQIRAIVDECKRLGKPYVNVEFSEADHAFFRDVGANYHPGASSLAWGLTESFLRLHVKEPHKRARIR